jgi:hypothetical protein
MYGHGSAEGTLTSQTESLAKRTASQNQPLHSRQLIQEKPGEDNLQILTSLRPFSALVSSEPCFFLVHHIH